MKARVVVLGLIACLFVAIATLAADNFSGTWKLNEAKSKLGSGLAKNSTVTYSMEGDNVKVSIDGTGTDGKPIHNEWVGKFDGKDYPVTGSATESSRALKQINDRTLEGTTKQVDKVSNHVKIVVAADGKTRTVTVDGTDAQGKKVHSVAVYDKQQN
jgi:hypothetical protein